MQSKTVALAPMPASMLIAGAVELRLHRVRRRRDLTERERGRIDLGKERFHGPGVAPALYFEVPTGKRRREIEFQFPRVFQRRFVNQSFGPLGTVVCQQICQLTHRD